MPISLHKKVARENTRLVDEGHIVKMQEYSDKLFVSSIVTAVEKKESLKVALESREQSKQIHNTK